MVSFFLKKKKTTYFLSYRYSLSGIDYPERIVIHEQVSVRNQRWMKEFRNRFTQMPPHCQPSSENEVFIYFGLFDEAQGFNC